MTTWLSDAVDTINMMVDLRGLTIGSREDDFCPYDADPMMRPRYFPSDGVPSLVSVGGELVIPRDMVWAIAAGSKTCSYEDVIAGTRLYTQYMSSSRICETHSVPLGDDGKPAHNNVVLYVAKMLVDVYLTGVTVHGFSPLSMNPEFYARHGLSVTTHSICGRQQITYGVANADRIIHIMCDGDHATLM